MRAILLYVMLSLSLNSWSAVANRLPTPNYMPSGVCSFKSKSFNIPKTDIRIYHVEVFTSARGTGCLKGQTHSFWDKCDIRPNETDEGSNPQITLLLKLRDNQTLQNTDQLMIPMTDIVDLGWVTDRKGNYKSIIETVKRKDVEILGSHLNIVTKRTIKNLNENKLQTEVLFYSMANPEKKIKSRLLYQARCESEITDRSY